MESTLILITTLSGILSEVVKKLAPKFTTKDVNHIIPIISLVSGICISIIFYYSNFCFVGETIIEAIICGCISGSGSVGIHQLPTQMRKYHQNDNDKDNVDKLNNIIESLKVVSDCIQESSKTVVNQNDNTDEFDTGEIIDVKNEN